MPGTYGSVLGVGLYLAFAHSASAFPHPRIALGVAAVVLTLLSVWVVSVALRGFNAKDPQEIVLDEVVGQFVTLAPLPVIPAKASSYWIAIAIGFILFRALDAAKPYPIWKLERLHGAWGVVLDDIGAGILGAFMLWCAMALGWRI
jgi:phosphatidylglycerophosphatase A